MTYTTNDNTDNSPTSEQINYSQTPPIPKKVII